MSNAYRKDGISMLESIGVIFRHVDDLDNAKVFYGNVLGLNELWSSPEGATAYSTGSGPLIIIDKKQRNIESEVQFNFETSNISDAYISMKAKGVDVGEIKIVGETSMFFFRDPEGYTMMVWANHKPDQDLPQQQG